MLPNAAPLLPPSGERKYKGVRRRRWGRWVSEIRLPNSRRRIWLGSYDTPVKAVRVFDAAYVCLRGPGGPDGLNFPGSPPDVGPSSDPQEVLAAAVSDANRAGPSTAAAPSPWEATEPADEPTPVHDGGAAVGTTAVPAPSLQLQGSVKIFDRSELVANPPPLFSPTIVGTLGSHPHLQVSLTAATDVDMENESGPCPGLWSFSSGGSSCTYSRSR